MKIICNNRNAAFNSGRKMENKTIYKSFLLFTTHWLVLHYTYSYQNLNHKSNLLSM